MLIRVGIRTLAILVLLGLGIVVLAQQTCDVQAQAILEAVNALCLNDARDSVCYGNIQVQAQPQPGVTSLNFQKPGDEERVALIKSLQLSPMNIEQSTWGIARMRLTPTTATSAADDVTVLLFGDVYLENQSDTRPTFDFTVKSNYDIRLRNFPALNSTIMDWLRPGDVVRALGRLADNSWVHVQKQPGGLVGWVSMDVLRDSDLSRQVNILLAEDGDAPYYGPMQAIAFTGNSTAPDCGGAVQDGLLIQTPEGVARVTLLINELTIDFVSTGTGTTALVNTQSGGLMAISMLEGAAYVTSGDTTQFIPPGAQLTVPMNGAGQPVLAMAQPVPNNPNVSVTSLYSGLDHQPETVIWDPTVRPVTNVVVAGVPSQNNPNATGSGNPGGSGNNPSGSSGSPNNVATEGNNVSPGSNPGVPPAGNNPPGAPPPPPGPPGGGDDSSGMGMGMGMGKH